MKLKRLCLGLVFVGLATLGLSGCSRLPCEYYLTHPPVIPRVPLIHLKKPLSPYQLRKYYLCLLETHGVQVIRAGQTWTLIFPNDDLFDNDTSEINENYEPLLNVAAAFMRTYSKMTVKISAYSNKPSEEVMTKFGTITDELTTRQAESVLAYFTSHPIGARFIVAVGKGGQKPVAWNGNEAGRRLNRRVEVSFRYYRDNAAWY